MAVTEGAVADAVRPSVVRRRAARRRSARSVDHESARPRHRLNNAVIEDR